MAQGKKTRDEDKANIIWIKLRDPQKSLRDIENETGINRETVSDIIDSVPWLLTSSDSWETIIEAIDWIISDIATITRLSITEYKDKLKEEKFSINDLKGLNEIAKNNFDRKQILTGKSTVNVNILWDILSDIQWITK